MHIMLDLETLDTKPSAIILSIGAVKFDASGVGDWASFYPDIDEQIRMGRTFNASTLFWWMHKDREEARKDILAGDRIPVTTALHYLSSFCDGAEGVWGNGSDFDNAMLRDIATFDLWPYHRNRCFRTLMNMNPDLYWPYSNMHTAVGDAMNQAKVASEILRRMK